ncbi:hypothetical protein E4U28_004644, partial [Claviceps purpurea]
MLDISQALWALPPWRFGCMHTAAVVNSISYRRSPLSVSTLHHSADSPIAEDEALLKQRAPEKT